MAMDPSGFSISVTEQGGRAVVAITGELDLATSPDLEEVVLGRLDEGKSVVLDLRELQFMDSSGLRVVITAHTRAGEGAGEFAIVRPASGSEVEKILAIAGVDQQLTIVDEP